MKNFLLSIVVPVYNEEAVLTRFFTVLGKNVSDYNYEVIFVDDGSVDSTQNILHHIMLSHKSVRTVRLKSNFGQQQAIYTGLSVAGGDCVVVLDADLQDPPHYINDMVKKWQKGYEIVFAKRKSRGDKPIKRLMAFVFYRIYRLINPVACLDTGDFYLLNRKVVKNIINIPRSKLFLRGAIAKQKLAKTSILIERKARVLGKSKYTVDKMIKLAIDAFRESRSGAINKHKTDIVERSISSSKHYDCDSQEDNKSVAIIGGGLSGLLIGYYLSKRGRSVTIYEQNNHLGGFLATDKYRNTLYDRYYHHLFLNDKLLLELLDELGLGSKIIWRKSTSACFKNNRFFSINSLSDWLHFPGVSIIDKIRGGISARVTTLINPARYHHVSSYKFIRLFFGLSFLNNFWKPLFEKKFYAKASNISAAWFIARLQKRAGSRQNGKEVLGCMKGSFQLLINELRESILRNGGKIELSSAIKNIHKRESGFRVQGKKFDYLVSAIANPKIILNNILTKQEIARQSRIKFFNVICANIISKQKLSNYYWTNIVDQNIPFVSFVEQTNLFKFKDRDLHLSYLGWYLPDEMCQNMDKKKIYRLARDAIKTIFPNLKEKLIIKINVGKYAQPVISANIEVPPAIVANKKVFITNMGHIFPEDRGLNEAVAEAQKICALLDSNN